MSIYENRPVRPVQSGFIFFILTFFSACTDSVNETAIDLSGSWQVELLECHAKAGPACTDLLQNKKSFSIDVPANLRSYAQAFTGSAAMTRLFTVEPGVKPAELNTLMAGALGSVDTVFINGAEIGRTGRHGRRLTVSAFNKVRSYQIPPGLIHRGENTLTLRIKVLDIKAGLHSSPVIIGNGEQLTMTEYLYRFIREYIFLSIPFLLLAVIFVFLSTIRYWRPGEGIVYLVIAFAGYFIHSFYYLPVPWPADYLLFLKLQWSGRIISVIATALYFYRYLGMKNRLPEIFFAAAGLCEIVIIFMQNHYDGYFRTTLWQQWSFLVQLVFPLLFFNRITDPDRRRLLVHYTILGIVVFITYVNDALVRSGDLNTAWMYHYLSIGNVINFLYHFSYHLYLWRKDEVINRDKKLLQQQLNLAHELHDMAGSQAAYLLHLSRDQKGENADEIFNESSNLLEKIRDFAHVLKGETTYSKPEDIFLKYCRRLSHLKRMQVRINGLSCREYENANPDRADDKSRATIYRIHLLQIERIIAEWVSNILQHAEADQIYFYIRKRKYNDNEVFSLIILNNGKSFKWRGIAESGGLAGISRRVSELDGSASSRVFSNLTVFRLVVRFQLSDERG